MARNNILLRRRVVPKKVTLPNSRTFSARFKRVIRSNLPPNVRDARTRTIGRGRCRRRRGIGMVRNLLKSELNKNSKLYKSAIGQKIIEEGIKNARYIYSAGVKRVSNKKPLRALEFELVNYVVKSVQNELYNWQNTKGISNFQIERAMKKIDDEDLNNNFVGVFPAEKITKFIDFKQLIQEKTAKYPFIIANTEDLSKDGKHWWSILDIEAKKEIFFSDSFGVEGLKNFIITTTKKQLKKY